LFQSHDKALSSQRTSLQRASPQLDRLETQATAGDGRGMEAMRRTRRRSAALMLSLLAMLAGASTALAQTWKEIEAAARKEGSVVLYHNFQPASAERIVAASNADYPETKVGEVRLPSGAFYPRFAAEYGGGKSEADACSAAWDDQLHAWAKQGWMGRSGSRRKRPSYPRIRGSATTCGASRPCAR
jgi:hypothetical protein